MLSISTRNRFLCVINNQNPYAYRCLNLLLRYVTLVCMSKKFHLTLAGAAFKAATTWMLFACKKHRNKNQEYINYNYK